MVFTNYYVFLKCAPYLRLGVTHKKAFYGRWHMTTNQIAYYEALESQRHNRVNETETNRSNLANEKISQQNADTAAKQASANMAGTIMSGISGLLF